MDFTFFQLLQQPFLGLELYGDTHEMGRTWSPLQQRGSSTTYLASHEVKNLLLLKSEPHVFIRSHHKVDLTTNRLGDFLCCSQHSCNGEKDVSNTNSVFSPSFISCPLSSQNSLLIQSDSSRLVLFLFTCKTFICLQSPPSTARMFLFSLQSGFLDSEILEDELFECENTLYVAGDFPF